MDAVNAFNMELFSMIDVKPPISRAKMMSVTKSAIKAIKLYKHVVQIVEKFIKKCKPELKVPGLYVVDSIVRQSRHQFGVDKDVFGPRFLKNFTDTFQNLYRCPEDDKSKIIRVLNLWQKNGVFDMSIIQPLMDMANGAIVDLPAQALEVPADPQPETQPPVTTAPVVPAVPQLPTPDALAAVAQLFQSPHGQELQRMLHNFQQADKTLAATITNNITTPPQMPATQLNPYSSHTEKKSSLAEKLLDRFDYDDEPDDIMAKDGSGQSLGIPENVFNQFPGQMPYTESVHPHMMGQSGCTEHGEGMSHDEHHMMLDGYRSIDEAYSRSRGNSREDSSRHEGRHRGYSRRSRSRSGSRSPRRRRSRSSSRSRRSRHRRSRSRSKERRWRSRSRSQDRNEREKDRERRQKGLPSMKSQTLSVCSTTLWVGQLDKKTQQSDVMSLLEEFGQIESINMIPPRGCAYIVMVHRQDAYTALNKLSRGSYKVNQRPVKIAWALNKGIKSAHKKFWDVERGVTYIPWSKVKVEELESYREGGLLDAETLNPEWNHGKDINKQAAVNGALQSVPADGTVTAHIQVPSVQQAEPIGSPPAFPGPIMLSPPSMPPGGPPFIPPEFDPTKLTPGSVKPPEESTKDSTGDKGTPSDPVTANKLGSPVAPMMTLPGPGVIHAPRPGMPPLQPPPGIPPPFFPPPSMPHMPPHMMPGGPMFPPNRFRMPMPFPPRGPPFHRHPAIRPEDMDDREGRPFRNGRPGFGPPPFPRARW
ncbi:SR-related and CTD-associated factor 4-like isoform X2 [Plectropomus leopardus]|uniref:SR-related and CTD-associated factor 4-like isoform X2 n=1 Tax=Plectropomus leopardus TaxID=160734 RepID=UPI001C4CDF21|nr:SR-related and CTD-associated factor 4-like isoform X2 [Plectropomus leopardus]